MKLALEAYPPSSFAVPAGVTVVNIDATNGRGANLFCPVVISETFLAGTEPAPCEEHGGVGDESATTTGGCLGATVRSGARTGATMGRRLWRRPALASTRRLL